MPQINSLVKLIQSMSKGEKKNFSMLAALQKGNKEYMRLFRLISGGSVPPQLKKEFLSGHPGAAYETSCKYLYAMLIKCLVQLHQDSGVNQWLAIMSEINLLFKKSLYQEGFARLQKLKTKAAGKEQHLVELWACHTEMHYYSQLHFHSLTEHELVKKQAHIDDLLKTIKQQHQHQQLYHLAKHRRLKKGDVGSPQHKAGFNDLIISELNLTNTPPPKTFESKKAHLLFQSHYFQITSDYTSAVKIFFQLNELFERNKNLWIDAPSDYLFMMEGIFDSLRTIKQYDALLLFTRQLQNTTLLSKAIMPGAERLIFIYRLAIHLDKGEFKEALAIVKRNEPTLNDHLGIFDATQKAEAYLYASLAWFVNNQFEKAHQFLQPVLLEHQMFYKLSVYKTFRLLGLLVHYELGNHDYIKHEIRSLKRQMQQEKDNKFLVEKAVFKFLSLDIKNCTTQQRKALWQKTKPELLLIEKDKYEVRLLKIFDFVSWIEAKLSGVSFSVLLKDKSSGPK